MPEIICPVCNAGSHSFIMAYKNIGPLFANRTIVACNDCSMFFCNPMPDDVSLDEYNAGYFDNAHGGISTNAVTVAFHSAINLLRVLHVEKFRPEDLVIKSVLEIGPGTGNFARHWMARNKQTEKYTAIESDKSCYASLEKEGVAVFAEIGQLPANGSFELVVMSHVLEHTAHPAAFIQDCTKRLLPGGVLFIEVPCRDFEHKGTVEPHLLFFDKAPMQQFLTRMGFEKIRLSYHGNTITHLQKKPSFYQRLQNKFRNALLARGVVFPFGNVEPGLEGIKDPLERAAVKPFKAHIEQSEPSWWLRAVAIKK
jgi:SAM-dependent methyltransferase